MIKSVDLKEVLELYDEVGIITTTAREYCSRHGIPYNDSIRRRFSELINANLNTNKSETESNNYSNDVEKKKILTAFDKDGSLMSIDRYCEVHGLNRSMVRSYKLVSHTGIPFYNIVFQDDVVEDIMKDTDFLENLVQKYIKPVTISDDMFALPGPTVDRLILADVHIGMDNTGDSNTTPLYNNPKYDSREILLRLRNTIKHVFQHQTSNKIFVDNLGDFLDGLMGQTTRGGHKLPQLMGDKEVFELGVQFQVELVELLLENYTNVVMNSVIEDNHSNLFGYFVHSAVKKILEAKYPDRVEYNIHNRFLSHYTVGVHTFILTHGKDSKDMKFGMKLNLDDKLITKIDQYCKEYKLYNGNLIELSKGDLHSYVADHTSSYDFEYINYPAFSPPSNWVQTNFGNQKSGIVFQSIELNEKVKSSTPLWF